MEYGYPYHVCQKQTTDNGLNRYYSLFKLSVFFHDYWQVYQEKDDFNANENQFAVMNCVDDEITLKKSLGVSC